MWKISIKIVYIREVMCEGLEGIQLSWDRFGEHGIKVRFFISKWIYRYREYLNFQEIPCSIYRGCYLLLIGKRMDRI